MSAKDQATAPPSGAIDAVDASHGAFAAKVRQALFWRSGAQVVTQIVSWASTLVVMRLLNPADYGLFAMAQVVLMFAQFLNGYGISTALVQAPTLTRHQLRQAFTLMLILNGALALVQWLSAPMIAAYYGKPVIATMLEVQALIYLSTPLIAVPEIVMARSMDYRKPAIVLLIAATATALTALIGALSGWGVWTLVVAPIVGFYVRGLGYLVALRFLPVPTLDLRGTGWMIAFGASLVGSQLFFMIQTQADIVIGGRLLDPHALGLYAEALFITMIFASKFLPPLNEVAFSSFARMQGDRQRMTQAFCRTSRLILLIACPICLGMAVSAEPLIVTLLGDKWQPMAPLVRIIALCMPFFVLQQLLNPALQAIGRPGLIMRIASYGALFMPVAYWLGIRVAGSSGLAWAWACGIPLLTLIAMRIAGRALGLGLGDFGRIMAPGLAASIAMALLVQGVDLMLAEGSSAPVRLALLVATGVASYGALLWIFARETMRDMWLLVRGQPAAIEQPGG